MPKQILLVEDELILCENYAKTIREHGYEVITCHSKQGALEIINRRLPDLAILDIGLGDEMSYQIHVNVSHGHHLTRFFEASFYLYVGQRAVPGQVNFSTDEGIN